MGADVSARCTRPSIYMLAVRWPALRLCMAVKRTRPGEFSALHLAAMRGFGATALQLAQLGMMSMCRLHPVHLSR
eukprot:3277341-Rhodomonas_salina.3